MAQLIRADFNQLIPQFGLLGQGFAQGQRISQNLANQQALAQQQQQAAQLSGQQQLAAGGDPAALQQVAGQDPQAALKIQQLLANQGEAERAEGLRENEVLTRTALAALNIGEPQKMRLFLERQKNLFTEQGRSTENIDRALSLDDDGMIQAVTLQAREGQTIQDIAKQQFPAALTESQVQTIDIKKATLDIRKEENKTRKLEQKLKSEDNALKREELQLKIDERKQKAETVKREAVELIQTGIRQIDSTLDTIDRVRNHPGLASATGVFSPLPTLPGSDAANFEAQIETLQSQQFLSAVSQMKGMGALSENEGKKLASSIGALNLNMSDEAMKAELDRIFEVTTKARARMAGRIPKEEVAEEEQPQDVRSPQERGFKLMVDAQGNRAFVGPNGEIEEVNNVAGGQ